MGGNDEAPRYTPRKLTWNPTVGGLVRCFSFSKGVCSGSMLVFEGVCCCLNGEKITGGIGIVAAGKPNNS